MAPKNSLSSRIRARPSVLDSSQPQQSTQSQTRVSRHTYDRLGDFIADSSDIDDDSDLIPTLPLDATIPCSSPLIPTQPLPSRVVRSSRNSSKENTQKSTQEESTISSPARRLTIEVPCSSPPPISPVQPKASKNAPTRQGMISSFFKSTAVNGSAQRAPPLPVSAKKRTFDLLDLSDESDQENRGAIHATTFGAKKRKPFTPPEEEVSRPAKSRAGLAQLDISSYKYVPPSPRSGTASVHSNAPASTNVSSKPATHAAITIPSDTEEPSPERPKRRRRLVQGRQPRPIDSDDESVGAAGAKSDGEESEGDWQPEPKRVTADKAHIVIDIDDDDEDELANDDVFVERHSSPEPDTGNRIVDTLNKIEIGDLAALTGEKQDILQALIAKRPFRSVYQIERTSIEKKVRGRLQDVNIGEGIVQKVSSFTKAINAVDNVVRESDRRAKIIEQELSSWAVDSVGSKKKNQSGTKHSAYWRSGQPADMNPEFPMHDYQIFGVNWMSLLCRKRFGGILADDMGLGKTCQVIGLMCRMVQDYDDGLYTDMPFPNLIVVPPSTLDNWVNEFSKFAPHLSIVKYSGTQDIRNQIADELVEDEIVPHVVLTSYTQMGTQADINNMNHLHVQHAIFDEGQVLKNPMTQQYQRLARLRVHWRLLLSGTPIQNHLMEMISLLNFVDPKLFAHEMEHIQYVFDHKIHSKNLANTALLYGERVNRARSILEPFILQRLKAHVGQNLPKKIQRIIHCELPPRQRALYDKYESLFRAEGDSEDKVVAAKKAAKAAKKAGARENDMNNVWIQLKKAALHPQLFRQHFDDKKVKEMATILYNKVDHKELDLAESKFPLLHNDLLGRSDFSLHLYCSDFPRLLSKFDIPADSWNDSGKVQTLLSLIDTYQKNGDRVLVFSKFSLVIEILSFVLTKNSISHCTLTGASAVSARQSEINRFQNDPSIPVFLLTTGAGGTGINLTAANKVVIFDMSSNPQDDKQAENRAHRLGQKREVEIVRLIAKGTVEELIYATCMKKIELADKVTGMDGGDGEADMRNAVREMMERREEVTIEEGIVEE